MILTMWTEHQEHILFFVAEILNSDILILFVASLYKVLVIQYSQISSRPAATVCLKKVSVL